MIIIYISQRAGCIIKPRQIINYDAGIVLIDLHQLNVKNNFRQYKSATLNTGQPHVNVKNRTRRTTTRNIRFPNQMIEQITTPGKKGPGISQPGSLKPAVGD